MRAPLLALTLIFAAAAAASGVARAAEPNGGGADAAESLFQEGRRAMDARRYGDACPKFLASHKLAPAIGTLLNLADCHEKNGQLASAWARFNEAIALAQRLGRTEREKTARERASKLEPRLSRLTILTQQPQVEVKLDGASIDPAVLGTPIPIDPGKHAIEASAKGKKTFAASVDVSERAKASSVEIPELEPSQGAAPPPPPKATPAPPTTDSPSGGKAQRVLGIVGMGLGAVGLGVGAYFGLRTSSTWSDAKAHCQGLECDPAGVDLAGQARTTGNVATIAFVAGGVLAVGGALLFFTAPSGEADAGSGVAFGVGPREVVVRGSF